MKQKNILKIARVLLIASLMVLSAIVVTANTTKLTTNPQTNAQLMGLAPNVPKKEEHQTSVTAGSKGYFLAYDTNLHYTCNFTTSARQTYLYYTGISWHLSGADIDSAGNWYAVSYVGDLYKIDTITGKPTLIGSTGITTLNSLVYDSTTGIWYACGWTGSDPDGLYKITTTGVATWIGYFGAPAKHTMISLMCDTAGNMYGYDVVTSGDSSLYTINKATGAASNPKDMGYAFLYAQEGKFDRNTGILYLATFDLSHKSYLATCDPSSGAVTMGNRFPNNAEIDALAIPWPQPVPDLIIYDRSNGPPVNKIKDNKYEPPNWLTSPLVTQTGKWVFHPLNSNFYLYLIQLQNDGTVPLSSYTITVTVISLGSGTILPGSRWYYVGSHPIGGSYSVPPGPSIGLPRFIPVIIRTSSPSMFFQVGINVIASSGGQDSVIIHN